MRSYLTLAVVLLASGCVDDTSIPASEVVCPTDSTLTYENFGSAFLRTNCLSCHTSREKPALTSLALVQANSAKIISAAVTSSNMPQDSSLTTAQRTQLGQWLACGAP
jgi:hypothetical protein